MKYFPCVRLNVGGPPPPPPSLLFDNFHSKKSLIIIIIHGLRFYIQVGAISSCGCEERQHLSVLKVMSKKGAHRSTTKHETEGK